MIDKVNHPSVVVGTIDSASSADRQILSSSSKHNNGYGYGHKTILPRNGNFIHFGNYWNTVLLVA